MPNFLPSDLNVADLDGTNGFILGGIDSYDNSGRSVSSAGDVNGDGFDDVIIGASRADPNGNNVAGESYVVFGAAGGFTPSLFLGALDGTNGFRIDGIDASDRSGESVSSAGDVNGDGFDDLIIGAFGGDPNGNNVAGESYVIFGAAGGFAPSLSLAALDGTNGFRLDGSDNYDSSGISVSSAGDVNGDGFDDVIIGAPGSQFTPISGGESYVVFGAAGGFASSLSLAVLDGTNGFRLDGIDINDQSGRSVSSAGDVNGDGFDDVIIGASGGDPNGNGGAGESYVVFGAAGGFSPSLSLAALDGSNGFRIDGIDARDLSGRSVSSAGDVNGDGFDDIIIGAIGGDPNGNSGAGESYVVFGAAGGFAPSLSLAALDGTNGFRIDGNDASDRSGYSVSSAGDFNGDGFDDVIIGAPGGEPDGYSGVGETYVVFGAADGFTPSLSVSELNRSNSFRIEGSIQFLENQIGVSVSAAGDVNGDGFDDVIIGADPYDLDGFGSAGRSYVIFGGPSIPSIEGTSGNDTLNGGTGDDIINGLDGDDIIQGGAGDDTLLGGVGDDLLAGGGGTDVIDGGAGIDTNSFADIGTGVSAFLGEAGTASHGNIRESFTNIENLTGTEFNDHLFGDSGNNVLIGLNGDDFLAGSSGDDNLQGARGMDMLIGGVGNDIIDGGNDDDVINGDTGDDTLRGSGGDDTIDGGTGVDTISAGIGDDTVNGGDGNDTILGQGGADMLFGDGGTDTLRGGSGNDTLFGGEDRDLLFGQGNNDILYGEGGNDTLSGAAGSDQLFGGAGDDTLLGSIGADRLDGGAGNDVLNGGNMDGARDTFVFAVGYDEDRVNSFDQAGTDRLELDEDLWAAAGTLTAQQVVDMFGSLNGSGTILTLDFGNGDILEVQSGAGIDADTLGADIVFI